MGVDRAGLTELASYLDIHKSTLHNYLSTLKQEEFVIKHQNTCSIGVRPLKVRAFARNQYPVYEIARPEVTRLAEETGFFAYLLIEEHG